MQRVLTPYDYDTVEEGKIVVWYSRGYQFLSLFSNTMKSVDWEKEFRKKYAIPEFNGGFIKHAVYTDEVIDFIHKLLSEQKKEILDRLPKKKVINKSKKYNADDRRYAYGFNECLLQVSKII